MCAVISFIGWTTNFRITGEKEKRKREETNNIPALIWGKMKKKKNKDHFFLPPTQSTCFKGINGNSVIILTPLCWPASLTQNVGDDSSNNR